MSEATWIPPEVQTELVMTEDEKWLEVGTGSLDSIEKSKPPAQLFGKCVVSGPRNEQRYPRS